MKLLIVDDEKILREKILRFLKFEADIEVIAAENGFSAQRLLETQHVDAVATDLNMPDMDGLALLRWIQDEQPALPVLMMSGCGEVQDAVDAMKIGAYDYVVKPFDLENFVARIRQMVAERGMLNKVEQGAQHEQSFYDWIGESSAMLEMKELVQHIAPTPSTVLIIGESGTGKEVVARMIHRLSPRAGQPFVAINVGGVPEALLESELFGHEKGAFTGADAKKIGLFETASSGTLFLDEIGEMPMHLQVKLLRVLQEREIQRLGATQSIPIDVRILAATNKNIEEQIHKGAFRDDLYYRLNIIRISLPPLRERQDDIPLLAGFFLQKYRQKVGKAIEGIDVEAIKALQQYRFPGNVRELENIIQRAIVFAKTDTILIKDLGIDIPSSQPKRIPRGGTLEELQKQAIIETLRRWEGNRTRAAKELGIDRKTLITKIKDYNLHDL